MAIGNDASVICDVCAGQYFRSPYIGGSTDITVELWPRWFSGPWGLGRRHDPGFHICLSCMRAMFAGQYARELAEMPRPTRRAA